MPDLPTGTVTFLFTDVEGSTRLWEQQPQAMRHAVDQHMVLQRAAIAANGGQVFRSTGDGLCAAFPIAPAAVLAALHAQQALLAEPSGTVGPLRVRMALHTGAVVVQQGDYVGACLNRLGRLLAAGHGGQVLLSQVTADLVREALPGDASLRDLGAQRLRDLSHAEHVCQLLHPGLPANFPALQSLDAYPHNLPLQLTSFIGRQREVAELTQVVTTGRLVTLTGVGGCGKTRLALQVAAALLPQFPDGVWCCELAPLGDPALVANAVAAATGVREVPGQPAVETLVAALRPRRLLLLLDNCEHLLEACAQLADALLRACPEVHVLATSREALGIAGERSRRVPSLSLPPAGKPLSLEQLAQCEAVQLFVERAVAVQPDFRLTEQQAPAVVRLCRRLDGIPLALELAAARVRSLSVEQVAARLDQRFRLLTGGSRTALPRQQTLRAAIDWSYDLLSVQERRLFNRLSVFSGDWTLEAAEAVAGDAPTASDGAAPSSGVGNDTVQPISSDDVLDVLMRLVDRSMVVAEAGPEEEVRYRLLETLRQYGREQLLTGGEAAAVHDRHAAYYLDLAEATGRTIGPESGERRSAYFAERQVGLARFEREQDNLTAALRWLIEQQDAERAVRLVHELMAFWFFRGGGEAAARYLTDLLALCRTVTAPPPVLVATVGVVAGLASQQGAHTMARALFEEYLRLTGEAAGGNSEQEALWLTESALVARNAGDLGEAQTLLEQSLAIYQQLGHEHGIATQLDRLGGIAHLDGKNAGARCQYEAALRVERPLAQEKSHDLLAWTLHNLGCLALDEADPAAARPLLEESLHIRRTRELRPLVVLTLGTFAALLAAEGQAERALRLATAVETLGAEIGFGLPPVQRRTAARWTDVARQALGERAATAAITAGRLLSFEEALAVALADRC